MTIASQPIPTTLDPRRIRADFPILQTTTHGKPLVYLDNGATTQKPRAVIDAIVRFYEHDNANIHRGVYELSQRSTEAFELARRKVQSLLNAPEAAECIFVRGTTEAINLVASSWGRMHLRSGDEVLVSALEHHSNIVPWQLACTATGATLRSIPMNDDGELLLDEYRRLLSGGRVRIVAVTHLSNSLGTVNDVKALAAIAHEHGALLLADGAQWVAHAPTDVQALGVDFYTFSGHKLFGPTGIGVLWGRRELLESMPPFMGGGDMIETVTFEQSTWAPIPAKFEAGTPDIAGAIGLGAAIDYVLQVGLDRIAAYEADLTRYALERLRAIPGVRIVGNASRRASAVSFVTANGLAAHDVATLLDLDGIAVRSGHHCTQPVMDRLGVAATVRATIAMYNTPDDIDRFAESLAKIAALPPMTRTVAPAADGVSASAADLQFPEPGARSVQQAADELIDTFDFLGDASERNHYIIDLGEHLPPMPAVLKNEATRVHGCMSTVHLFSRPRGDRLDFLADSDAAIVRGLVAILQKLFAGQKASEIAAFDVESLFRRLKLEQHITTQRRSGLEAMVQRIRSHANVVLKNGDRA
jgi:cysteine desulfurase/selenocysteine lyase